MPHPPIDDPGLAPGQGVGQTHVVEHPHVQGGVHAGHAQVNHGERQRHIRQIGVFGGARPRLPRQHQRMLTQANLKQLGIMSGTSPLQHGHEIIHIAGGEEVLGVAGGLVPVGGQLPENPLIHDAQRGFIPFGKLVGVPT